MNPAIVEVILIGLLVILFLRWLYSISYPRKEIKIKCNGEIIKRRRALLSLSPRDIINVRPDRGVGENNIQFVVPPDIGEVTFHIRCEIFKEDTYSIRNGSKVFYGGPV